MKLMKMVIKRGYSTRNYPRKHLSSRSSSFSSYFFLISRRNPSGSYFLIENRILLLIATMHGEKKEIRTAIIMESENLQFTITDNFDCRYFNRPNGSRMYEG